jgi:hypothetical protein
MVNSLRLNEIIISAEMTLDMIRLSQVFWEDKKLGYVGEIGNFERAVFMQIRIVICNILTQFALMNF